MIYGTAIIVLFKLLQEKKTSANLIANNNKNSFSNNNGKHLSLGVKQILKCMRVYDWNEKKTTTQNRPLHESSTWSFYDERKKNRNGAAQNKENTTHNNAVIFPIAFVLIDKISMSRDTCMQCCVFFRMIIKMQEQ